jgi:hypothetical protein
MNQDSVQMLQGETAGADRAATRPRDCVRDRSKSLFGNSDRLAVAVAVARSDGWVNATDVHMAMPHIAVNRIRAQLVALVEAELMDNAPPVAESRRVWYVRRDHSFWQTCLDLEAAWTAAPPREAEPAR